MENLRKLCEEYFRLSSEDEYIDDDLEHYIFEAAMEEAFGKDVWKKMENARKEAEIRRKEEEIEALRKELGGK